MKLGIHESLLDLGRGRNQHDLDCLGLRGVEVRASSINLNSERSARLCVIDSEVTISALAPAVPIKEWTHWFQAAREAGAQGVAVAVSPNGDAQSLKDTVWKLSEIALDQGSRLLLTVRAHHSDEPGCHHGPLIAWCRERDGLGVGLILDVGAAFTLGESPRRLLREGEGYVQHVRLPSPAWRVVPDDAIVATLQELQRISYIDYVALFGPLGPDSVALHHAVSALRQAIQTAWA